LFDTLQELTSPSFFEQVMAEDSSRARKCHDFLKELRGTDNTSPQSGS
jgi:hypothetical protein